ncbi:hypothetical protein ACVNRM_21085 [Bacillus paranthracis]|uniref:hypothetical protein n=2 Tax=Bacillus TaxID=1386 RepID=UPI0005E77A4E|nr:MULTISPECIES: hypothetical protein [Bacillus cereus group]KXI55441.1 hypothetical protein ACS45_01910 [Bacillus cereus]CKE88079.1 Uncharacterised protein [Streptococcus pneumoniae]MCZ7523313.1 hypothetical protein [Bacillus pacificus]MDA1574687.1 hypothetical protein [Bacillus cereus group sp. TH242-3LC]MDA1827348.1 hypothetical protein [Bacillus cereus group sp. BY25LC]
MCSLQLDQVNSDPLYSKTLKYWYDEWKSFSGEVKDGTIGIDIVNIRVVLLDVINEYELNKFQSENNRKVYIKLIENLISERHMKLYRNELLILKEKLETKDGQVAYVIAKELSKKISKENFAQILFDELLVIIEKKLFSKKDRIKIKNLTKDIIIDLVTLGKNIEDIETLLSDVFQTYSVPEELGEIFIFFKYTPTGLSPEQAKEYIDNLSVKDRLEIFRKNLIATKSDYLFIFPVWGMIAPPPTEENDTIFGFHVYDPAREKKLTDAELWLDETFKKREPEEDVKNTYEYDSRCNVMITVHAISENVAKKIAEEKYLNFLGLANLKFGGKYKEFFWDGQYIGKNVNSDYGSFGSALGSDNNDRVFRRNYSQANPVYFSDEKYRQMKEYSKVIDALEKRNMFIESNSIINVIELMSKSIWETEENKLLNYWICIESLANISKKHNESNFSFIKETISNIYFLWEQFRPLHSLFSLTEYYTRHSFENDVSIYIPEEFLEDVCIYQSRSEDSVVSLVKFHKRMEELLDYTKKESFLDSIEDTRDFYQDNKKALQMLQNKKDEVKLTIDYIYKSRNQIVHNGYVAKNLIPYLVNFAEVYAKALFQRIIDVYLEDEFDLQNYFIKEQYEGTLLEKKLSSRDFYKIGLEE